MRSEHRIPFVSVRVISVLLLLVLLVFPLFEEGAGSMNFKEGRRLIGTLAALASGTVELGDWPCVFEIISAVFTGILLLAAFTKIKPLCTLSCFLALCGLITAGAVYIHLDSGVHDIFGATSDFSLCMWVVLGLFLLGFFCSLILDPPGDNFGWLITFSFLLFMLVLIFPVFEPNGGTLNFGIRGNLRAWIETLREGGSVGAEKWTVIFTLAITIPAGLAFFFAILRKKIPAIVFASIGLLGWLCCMATFMVWTGKRG
ncbi:MAG: hypothetical protein J6P98_07295, partial [Clostridia bacterium]|nr:hypothetical protein [Clostridia bacterium]